MPVIINHLFQQGLRWIDSDSDFAPTIYVALDRILEAVDEIEERIARIPKSRTVKISDLAESPKHLLFFLCDLISVIHPATEGMVDYYLRNIAPSTGGQGQSGRRTRYLLFAH